MLMPFAGTKLQDSRTHVKSDDSVCVLTAIQEKKAVVFVRPRLSYVSSYPIDENAKALRDCWALGYHTRVVQAAQALFKRQADIPQRGISVPARRAARAVVSEYREDIANGPRRMTALLSTTQL